MSPKVYGPYCTLVSILIGLMPDGRAEDQALPGTGRPCCCSQPSEPVVRVAGSVEEVVGPWVKDDGQKFTFKSIEHHPCVIAMFYASCEMTCPMTLQALRDIESRLSTPIRKEVRFILVTLDPENDTPKALKSYRRKEGLAKDRWILLQGSKQSVAQLAALLGVSYGADAFGRRSHSSVVSLLDGDGRVVLQQPNLNGDFKPMVASLRGAAAFSGHDSP